MRDRHIFLGAEAAGEQVQGPASLSRRWLAAPKGREPRFLFTRKRWSGRAMTSFLDRRLHAVGHRPLSESLHRLAAHPERFRDLRVPPLRSFRPGIRLQKDACVHGFPRHGALVFDRLLEHETVGIGEGDDGQLGHGEATPWWGLSTLPPHYPCLQLSRGEPLGPVV